jgi:hypothetical protein
MRASAELLGLDGCDWVRDLTPLASLPRLRSLFLSGTPVADLTPLTALTDLDRLELSQCDHAEQVMTVEQHASDPIGERGESEER